MTDSTRTSDDILWENRRRDLFQHYRKRYLRVGFDLDGVLYNFGESVKRYLDQTEQGHLWKSGPTPAPYWDFYKDWGWNGKQFVEFCDAGADAGVIFTGPAREDAANLVKAVKALGHTVVIITDRQFGETPEVSHENTRQWLAKHEIPYDELHFSADKNIVPTDMFIEDKLENYDALTEAGVDAYLVNRPWNDVEPDNRQRIDDITQYYARVLYKGIVPVD